MKTTEQGLKAEEAVADLLVQQGFELIHKNWKTKVCEIDLVLQNGEVIYFVEVKYRSGEFQGDGFEYITPKKQKRMDFAAQIWKQTYNWSDDYRLMAAAVSGPDCQNIQIIELN